MFKILNEIVKISIIIVSFFFFFFKIYCFIFPISKVVIQMNAFINFLVIRKISSNLFSVLVIFGITKNDVIESVPLSYGYINVQSARMRVERVFPELIICKAFIQFSKKKQKSLWGSFTNLYYLNYEAFIYLCVEIDL